MKEKQSKHCVEVISIFIMLRMMFATDREKLFNCITILFWRVEGIIISLVLVSSTSARTCDPTWQLAEDKCFKWVQFYSFLHKYHTLTATYNLENDILCLWQFYVCDTFMSMILLCLWYLVFARLTCKSNKIEFRYLIYV